MVSRLHNKFGTASLMVAIVALVAALTGAAFAAGGLTKQQEKQVKKIAKKYAGKQGPSGPQGPKGDTGAAGAQGNPGPSGKNVVTTSITTAGLEGHCVGVGGTRLQVEASEAKEYVCNGANGQTGFTETLPKGKTLKGSWGYSDNTSSGANTEYAPISFGIPLSTVPTLVYVETAGANATECPGSVTEPEAVEGFLCVYLKEAPYSFHAGELKQVITQNGLTTKGGTTLRFFVEAEAGGSTAVGTWAVTAE